MKLLFSFLFLNFLLDPTPGAIEPLTTEASAPWECQRITSAQFEAYASYLAPGIYTYYYYARVTNPGSFHGLFFFFRLFI